MPNTAARATPMLEVRSVPKISGKIPNWPLPASQCLETTKLGPYFRIAGIASFEMRITMSVTTTALNAAKARVAHLKDASTARSRAVGGRAMLLRSTVGVFMAVACAEVSS
jgi:hypothetical protein